MDAVDVNELMRDFINARDVRAVVLSLILIVRPVLASHVTYKTAITFVVRTMALLCISHNKLWMSGFWKTLGDSLPFA